MQYAVGRICGMLSSSTSEEQKKKLTPVQVDLIEGVKVAAVSCHTALRAVLTQDENSGGKTLTQDDVHQLIEQSDLNGKKLASQCTGSVPAIELVRRSLENL